MTKEDAISKLEQLLRKHRQTHIGWRDYFVRSPQAEQKYVNSTGGRVSQEESIAAYDEALEAVDVLKGCFSASDEDSAPDKLCNMLEDKDIKGEIDCTHLVPPRTEMEVLHDVVLQTHQLQIDIHRYAGIAFLDGDEKQMEYFKGFNNGLKLLQEDLNEQCLRTAVEEYKSEEESKTFALKVKYQMGALLPHDHALFDDIVDGLKYKGWVEEGGSLTYRLFHKQDAAIKMFRSEEVSGVIKICFSAEPEKEVDGGGEPSVEE